MHEIIITQNTMSLELEKVIEEPVFVAAPHLPEQCSDVLDNKEYRAKIVVNAPSDWFVEAGDETVDCTLKEKFSNCAIAIQLQHKVLFPCSKQAITDYMEELCTELEDLYAATSANDIFDALLGEVEDQKDVYCSKPADMSESREASSLQTTDESLCDPEKMYNRWSPEYQISKFLDLCLCEDCRNRKCLLGDGVDVHCRCINCRVDGFFFECTNAANCGRIGGESENCQCIKCEVKEQIWGENNF